MQRGKAAHKEWDKRYAVGRKGNADGAALVDRMLAGKVPNGLQKALPSFPADTEKGMSTRAASGKVLDAIADVMPELWGGSGRPGRVQQHDDGRPTLLHPHREADQGVARRPRRPDVALRHP
jgi:transketolase